MDAVLAGVTTVGSAATTTIDDEPVDTTVTVDTKAEEAPTVDVSDDSEDDTISYFEKLAEDE